MAQDKLLITAYRDEYTIGLTGHLYVGGFSGFGEGWFNTIDVLNFSSKLKSLAEKMEGTAELLGTQSKTDGSEYLERFCLRCYVLANSKINGIAGIHVTLSEYPYTDCRQQEILKVSGELKLRNHKLIEFSDNLRNLVLGNVNDVSLYGNLNVI